MVAEIGQRRLGRYELLDLLGRGSATESYRARSFGVEGFEKKLVIKRLLPDLVATPDFVPAFLEHVQRAMRLSHANLAQVFDLGRDATPDGETYFLATEYVSGVDVATLLERVQSSGSGLPLAAATYLALEIAKALDHAHRRKDDQQRPLGVVHGAVAPHNVIVSFDGDVKLTDFGVVRATLGLPNPRGSLHRSYAVISPEQARGAEPTVESDIFSLGAFLYTAISGRAPFGMATFEETRRMAARGIVEPLHSIRRDVPTRLIEAVHRALALDKVHRFRSASAFYEELLDCVHAESLRFGSGELSGLIDQFRDAPPTLPGEPIDTLLARPLTAPPPALDSDPGIDDAEPSVRPSVPSLTGFEETRHVSVLVLNVRQRGEPPREQIERIHSALARYGGTILSESRHEVAAIFGVDRSDGRDTEAAARCGLVLVRGLDASGVAPSVGISAGRFRGGLGHDLGSDERLQRIVTSARAQAGDTERVVSISRRVVPLLRGRFAMEPLGNAFRVTKFAQDGFTDAFVGRKAELARLGEVLVNSARGLLRIVRVEGEPGIGKTRLAVEMQRRLTRGAVDLQTYFATCPPRGRELPRSGIVSMLRRISGLRDGDSGERVELLGPRFRALGLDEGETRAILSELAPALVSNRAPAPASFRSGVLRMMHSLAQDRFTVFVWDDAHELDGTSTELLARAATRLAGSRLAFVLVGRPDPDAPYSSLPSHAEVEVGEMEEVDVERLVRVRLGVDDVPAPLLAFLDGRAGGQPMFIEELLVQLEHSGDLQLEDGKVTHLALDEGLRVPRTLRALVGDRLRRLSEDELNLFVAAAVLEPPVSASVLALMVSSPLGVVETTAESLVARGLFSRDDSQSFGFPSRLSREVVLSELDPEELGRLHRCAATAYLEMGASRDEGADRAGYHLALAGDRDAAADLYARGGFHALSEVRLDRAALDLSYALELTELDLRSTSQLEEWLSALASAIRHVKVGPRVDVLVDRVARRTLGLGVDTATRSRIRVHLASVLGALDEHLSAEALLDAGNDEHQEDTTHYLAVRAELAASRGDFRLARRFLDPLSRKVVTDEFELHRIALVMAATLGATLKDAAAQAALEDAGRVATWKAPFLALERAVVRTGLSMSAGRWREAAESAMQAASQAEELGLVYEVASCLSEQAVALAFANELERSRSSVASAVSAAEEASASRVLARCALVDAYLSAEMRSDLEQLRQRISLVESRGWVRESLLGKWLCGHAALRLGARDDARRDFEAGANLSTSTGNRADFVRFSEQLKSLS